MIIQSSNMQTASARNYTSRTYSYTGVQVLNDGGQKNGQTFSDEITEKVEFEFVLYEIYVPGGNVAAIKRRQNVAAADEQKSAVSV